MFVGSYLQDIFMVIRDNNLYFYNLTRKIWITTTRLKPNTPYENYLYHGKNLIALFTNTSNYNITGMLPGKNITYFLVVNHTTTSDELQFVPITNPYNQLHKYAPYSPLNILIYLQNPTDSTASLRYIQLNRFRATCYTTDNEWTQLPLPPTTTRTDTYNKTKSFNIYTNNDY